MLIDQSLGGPVDAGADQQPADFLKGDLARAQHVAPAEERLGCKPVGQEGQANSVITDRLNSGTWVGWGWCRGLACGIELIRMQPDDQCKPVARDFLRFQADFDLKVGGIHPDQAAAEIISAPGTNEVRGRIFLLQTGQREQAIALGSVQLDDGV